MDLSSRRPVGRHPAPVDLWARALDFDQDHQRLVDVASALLFGGVTIVWLLGRPHDVLADWVCDVALVIPLMWRRARSAAAFLVIAAVALVQWFTAGPLLGDAALLVALFTVASLRRARDWVVAAAIVETGVVMASLRWYLAGSWVRSLIGLSGLAMGTVLAALVLRSRKAHQLELAERARRLQLERDQQAQIATAAERTRIAREMHDVIAHSLAVMIALADGASSKLGRDPERAKVAIDQVAEAGRQALGETRRLLGVLRESKGDPSSALAPQPGLTELDSLLTQVRVTGLDATLAVEGAPFELGAGAALTVFRIVQEASTNSLKHAVDATTVAVTLTYEWPTLRIEVADDGRPTDRPPGLGGHGLSGMRERVALYDGTLVAAHRGEGFVVSASLNVEGSQGLVGAGRDRERR